MDSAGKDQETSVHTDADDDNDGLNIAHVTQSTHATLDVI